MLTRPRSPVRPAERRAWPGRAALLLALILPASPAAAEVGASVSLVTDDRFRARSVSSGEPALVVDLSYDHPSGFYLGAGGSAAAQDSAPEMVRFYANAGFARRLASADVIDVGAIHTEYTEYFGAGGSTNYTEVYAGYLTKGVALYVYYSPDNVRPGVETLYLEASGAVELSPAWRLTARAGVLTRLTDPPGATGDRIGYDWRLGLTRAVGPAEIELAVSDGGPEREFYDGRRHDRLAVTAALTLSL